MGFFVCGMMGRFEYMHKKAIFILLLIIYSGDIRTQNFDELPLYISPGLQIGYHFGSNLYFSYQVTTGLYVDTPSLPGITIGKRHYYYRFRNRFRKDKKVESFTYLDGQINLVLGGFGGGKMWNSDGESFTKTKLWVITPAIILFSYDYVSFIDKSNHHIGVFGVLPYPLEGYPFFVCFAKGTKISMADESIKEIQDIEIGDSVLSYNLSTSTIEPDEVLELHTGFNNNMMEMTFSDGTIIHSTFDHPYRVKHKGWCSIKPDMTNDILTNIKDAKQLEVGDKCFLLKDGKITEVEFISSKSIPDFQTTYTIKKLKKNNTYFADGVMVGSETLKEKKPNRFLSLIK